MTEQQRKALKLALEVLRMPCNYRNKTQYIKVQEAIKAGEAALAQPEQDEDRFCDANCTWLDHHPNCKYGEPEQEPVAWELGAEVYWGDSPEMSDYVRNEGTPLYTTPPQRKPLTVWTEVQHERAYKNSPELHKDVKSLAAFKRVAKAIAAMYGIKE